MMLKWSKMFVADDKSLQVRFTRISRFSALLVFSSILLVSASGCSNQNADGDSWNDAVRLVQSGGEPPVEIIPTPTPDGVPERESGAEPSAPAKTNAQAKDPAKNPAMGQSKTGAGPEIVPVPEGVPMAKAMKQPAVQPETPDSSPSEASNARSSDAEKSMSIQDELAVDGPEDYRTWPAPDVALIVTGQQNGYIEPCGCTGLDRQKGGVARRFTFMSQLRQQGWQLVPIDAGNQVRRFGRQAEIKFQQTAEALRSMQYKMVGFGPDDVRLGVGELLAVVASDSPSTALYASSNVVILDPSLMPRHKTVAAGNFRIGLTSILDPDAMDAPPVEEIVIEEPAEAARKSLAAMEKESVNFKVLTVYGKEEAAQELARELAGFDLIVVAGGYGEPTYKPQPIDGSSAQMIVTGNKGMYAGIVGLYANQPLKYARVPLTHEFQDAPEMRQLMQSYQDQLQAVGLDGLGLKPIPHLSGEEFVGTETCGECHTEAYDVWEFTAHAEATAHIVEPPKERGDIARHFDPECISCHVTGWNPQDYQPYESGYLSLQQSEHLKGNGCENCHGPGSSHSAAEREGSGASEERLKELRLSMRLPLEKARERCMECHDLDNSPDFHVEDAFEDDYWPQVEHYGVD